MIEKYSPGLDQPKNLHDIPTLQIVRVRDDILLRPLRSGDAAEMLEILKADPAIKDRVYVASKMHTPEDIADEVRSSEKDHHLIRYSIVESGEVIGLVSFWRNTDNPFGEPDSPDEYGFGYFLSPDKRGRGIISDAVLSVIRTANEALQVRQFIAYCEDNNPDSIAVLKKLGFQQAGAVSEPGSDHFGHKYIRKSGV